MPAEGDDGGVLWSRAVTADALRAFGSGPGTGVLSGALPVACREGGSVRFCPSVWGCRIGMGAVVTVEARVSTVFMDLGGKTNEGGPDSRTLASLDASAEILGASVDISASKAISGLSLLSMDPNSGIRPGATSGRAGPGGGTPALRRARFWMKSPIGPLLCKGL